MKYTLEKILRVSTTQYEYEIVKAGVEHDTAVDGLLVSPADHLNGVVDDILRPELIRLYEVTDAGQASFVIPYVEPHLEGAQNAN